MRSISEPHNNNTNNVCALGHADKPMTTTIERHGNIARSRTENAKRDKYTKNDEGIVNISDMRRDLRLESSLNSIYSLDFVGVNSGDALTTSSVHPLLSTQPLRLSRE